MVRVETRTTGDAVRILEVHLERTGGVTRRLSWREVW
jgi:hypothetical protein